MIKYVSKYQKEEKPKDTTWHFTKDGDLPDSDRYVLAITGLSPFISNSKRSIISTQFDPECGWKGAYLVIAWRELDDEIIKLLNEKQ